MEFIFGEGHIILTFEIYKILVHKLILIKPILFHTANESRIFSLKSLYAKNIGLVMHNMKIYIDIPCRNYTRLAIIISSFLKLIEYLEQKP